MCIDRLITLPASCVWFERTKENSAKARRPDLAFMARRASFLASGKAPIAEASWSLSQSWLNIPGAAVPLTVESGELPVADDEHANANASSGASSVLALHSSPASRSQWPALAAALRRQQADAVAKYEAGARPEAPIWNTPRAICAPNFFGSGKTSPWPDEHRAQTLDDHVRLVKSAAATAHAKKTEDSAMDNAQFIALLKDLGVPTGRLERHFFEGHTSTSLAETIVDNNSALGMSMERLGGLKDRHGTAPAITASAPPRWRIVGQGMGGGVAAHAAASDPQFAASLDAIVLFEPHAFALLSDPRSCDPDGLRQWQALAHELVAHHRDRNFAAWTQAFARLYLPRTELLDETVDAALRASAAHITLETRATLAAVEAAAAAPSVRPVDALRSLKSCAKHFVMSASPGAGAERALRALSSLLVTHAGFAEHQAPEGGHLALSTHAATIMPLLARCLLDMPES